MASERPVALVQNPALGAILLWRFCRGFQKERPDALPLLPSLFCVLPIVYHGPTLRDLKSTLLPSGLVRFATKLGEEREALMAIHDRALVMRELTLESIATGIAAGVLRLNYSNAEVSGIEEHPPIVPDRLKDHHSGAEKLGHWFARLPLSHALSTLRIEI
ncbi:three component ABC system middle component [Bradyrhizobium sp. HKCCYLRH3083]|uniref:three component ABC system middle component n=1 Tax=unclassified Bradyrhizobium TaxID=2631580 RepID=UPI003EBC4E11